MASPIRRESFWAASKQLPTVNEALAVVLSELDATARKELGDEAIPISIDHQVTVYGRPGDTAPSFLTSIFKDTPILPSKAQYQVTATAIYEVFTTS